MVEVEKSAGPATTAESALDSVEFAAVELAAVAGAAEDSVAAAETVVAVAVAAAT